MTLGEKKEIGFVKLDKIYIYLEDVNCFPRSSILFEFKINSVPEMSVVISINLFDIRNILWLIRADQLICNISHREPPSSWFHSIALLKFISPNPKIYATFKSLFIIYFWIYEFMEFLCLFEFITVCLDQNECWETQYCWTICVLLFSNFERKKKKRNHWE